MRVTVAVAPSQNTPDIPKWQIREDASKAGRHADLIGFTEIREEEDFEAVTRGLGILWRLWALTVNCPIAVRRSIFNVLTYNSIRLHAADSHIPTPARYLAWVLMKRRLSLSKKRVVHMNTHLINRPDESERRRDLWWDSWAVIKDTAERMHREGHIVVITGDFNKINLPAIHGLRWVAGQGSIIKIGVLPPDGWVCKVENVWSETQNADHRALFARLLITKVG